MATSTTETDFATLRADLTALTRDVAGLIEHLKLGATNTAQAAAAEVDDSARRLYRSVAAEGERSAKLIGRQVEQQPVVALLIALGIGYIGARVLSR